MTWRGPRPAGSTKTNGYTGQHRRLRKQWEPKVKAGTVNCWRCGYLIQPWMEWDLGHDDYDRGIYRGPEHRYRTSYCTGNRNAGAIKGRKLQHKGRRSIRVMDDSRTW